MTFRNREELKIYHLERARNFHESFLKDNKKRDWEGMVNNQWAYSCVDFLDEEFFTEREEKRQLMVDWVKNRILELTEESKDVEKKLMLSTFDGYVDLEKIKAPIGEGCNYIEIELDLFIEKYFCQKLLINKSYMYKLYYEFCIEDKGRIVKMYSGILKKLLPPEENDLNFKDKIARAKEYPIDQLIHIKDGFAKCLWHNDKTPSMKYYPKTNDVYCFSCHKYADAIDVAMRSFGCSFINALNKLN